MEAPTNQQSSIRRVCTHPHPASVPCMSLSPLSSRRHGTREGYKRSLTRNHGPTPVLGVPASGDLWILSFFPSTLTTSCVLEAGTGEPSSFVGCHSSVHGIMAPRQRVYLPRKDYELPDVDLLTLIYGTYMHLKPTHAKYINPARSLFLTYIPPGIQNLQKHGAPKRPSCTPKPACPPTT